MVIVTTMIRFKQILLLVSALLCHQILAKEIDSEKDLQQEESLQLPAEHRGDYGGGDYGNGLVPHGHDPWPGGRPDMAQIKALNVKCEKNHMKVYIEFDRPFYGMIFSKGHYSDSKCVHLPPGTGHLESKFDIFLGGCGMTSSQGSGYNQHEQTSGLFIENTIIVQYDPQVQEIWDQARRLRCTWYDYYEKAVTFRPFQVDMLDAVTANFLGDNIQCWMQIQVGKGPWASEVAGIVKIGQTMTMVLAIKDEENKFDMLVRNCIAHDGHHQPIQLVDEYGCVVRPKIMSPFQKVKNFGASASVVSYAYFQAFKFPDSMNVHFQCVIQVCRYECPVPQCAGDLGGGYLPAPRDPSSYSENKVVSYTNTEGHIEANPHQALLAGDHDGALAHAAVEHHSDGAHLTDKEYGPVFFNRQGEQLPAKGNNIKIGGGYGVSGTGGTPRALKDNNRKKRQAKEQMTDIPTQKVIQVVAPGDVAFSLPSEEKETVVYASRGDGEGICMSVPSFAVGLVFLLLLLAISTLVAGFLFMRVKHLSGKEDNSISYDNTEFLKVAVPMAH